MIQSTVFSILKELGSLCLFIGQVFHTAYYTRSNIRPIAEQMLEVIQRSFATVVFAGTFVGAILVLQFNFVLAQYDGQIYLGGLNTSAVVREVGPLIISFLLAGKIGAFTAAELGTMRITEQIDAIECLGTNPIQYLVIPRYFAIIASSLILLAFGMMISILGSMGVAYWMCNVNPLQFMGNIPAFSGKWTLFCGATKSIVYGFIVASVSCHRGYTASGGARGVGRAVNQAAIYTSLYIVLANYFTSHMLDTAFHLVSAIGAPFGSPE